MWFYLAPSWHLLPTKPWPIMITKRRLYGPWSTTPAIDFQFLEPEIIIRQFFARWTYPWSRPCGYSDWSGDVGVSEFFKCLISIVWGRTLSVSTDIWSHHFSRIEWLWGQILQGYMYSICKWSPRSLRGSGYSQWPKLSLLWPSGILDCFTVSKYNWTVGILKRPKLLHLNVDFLIFSNQAMRS